jgi:hypothetical protein
VKWRSAGLRPTTLLVWEPLFRIQHTSVSNAPMLGLRDDPNVACHYPLVNQQDFGAKQVATAKVNRVRADRGDPRHGLRLMALSTLPD